MTHGLKFTYYAHSGSTGWKEKFVRGYQMNSFDLMEVHTRKKLVAKLILTLNFKVKFNY